MYMFGDACVAISVKLCRKILNNESSAKCDSRLLLSFGAFLWEIVVWYPYQKKLFIEQGGVFLILDLIQVIIDAIHVLHKHRF